jgi:ATP-dependent Clp protease adaptor protein ClpS
MSSELSQLLALWSPQCSHSSQDSGENEDHEAGDTGVAVEEGRPKLKEPPRYAVVLHNDDYTTMEFVVEVLMKYFRKTHEEAMDITMKVHHEGRGVAGIYSYEIAETKAAQVSDYAQAHQHPLKASVEPT